MKKANKMRGVVLAGGTGSRLLPLTKVTNKHLLPIGKKPMIFYPIEKLIAAGINDILIVTGKLHMGEVVSTLGSGKDFGCSFTYRVQEEAGGIAQALDLADDFVGNDRVVAILGDNIFEDNLKPYVGEFRKQKSGAKLLLTRHEERERFGVAEIKDNKIVSIEEKPKNPKSNLIVTGVYMYDNHVFDIIKMLTPSWRGELEITDVNKAYAKEGNITHNILKGWWIDAGTFDAYKLANELVWK